MLNTRQEQLLNLLKQKKTIAIPHLADLLSYSASTIRRDLILLEEMGLVKRDKGNVSIIVTTTKEKHFKLRNQENISIKQTLAQLATDFITDGSSMFLDSSSTVLQLCPLLNNYKNITVVTNGIEVAHSLIEHTACEVFVVGGYAREGSSGIVGESALEYIKQFNLDLCIMSCAGVDHKGFTDPSMQQACTKKQMCEQSRLTLMLCDHTKFLNNYKFNLASFNQVDYLLTDQEPSSSIFEAARQNNCEILWPH